jgi:hypothetical protein
MFFSQYFIKIWSPPHDVLRCRCFSHNISSKYIPRLKVSWGAVVFLTLFHQNIVCSSWCHEGQVFFLVIFNTFLIVYVTSSKYMTHLCTMGKLVATDCNWSFNSLQTFSKWGNWQLDCSQIWATATKKRPDCGLVQFGPQSFFGPMEGSQSFQHSRELEHVRITCDTGCGCK